MTLSLLAQFSVLLVEDDDSLRYIYSRMLSKKFKSVYTANNGKEGYEIHLTHQPELIFTDISMPVMDGLQMIKKIKEINPDTTAVIITAYQDPNYYQEAIRLSVFRYLVKPLNYPQFESLLNELGNFLQKIKEKELREAGQAELIEQLRTELQFKEDLLRRYRKLYGDLPSNFD